MNIDIAIVLVYFAFLIGLGWVFRSATANTSEYFRGGGKKMLVTVGGFLLLLVLIPNPLRGRMLFALVALIVGGIGFLLLQWAKLAKRKSPVQIDDLN